MLYFILKRKPGITKANMLLVMYKIPEAESMPRMTNPEIPQATHAQ